MERWHGQVAIVTGASSGIGAAIAEAFAKNGLKVAGIARRAERVEELKEKVRGCSGELHAVKCDLMQENDIERAFKWVEDNLGPVSILVNNAGILKRGMLTDGPVSSWRETIETNVMALCICTKLAIASMRKANIDGHIVHINSIAGHKVNNLQGFGVYSATKFGVTALTETLRYELISLNSKIKVTSVSPGFVLTEIINFDDLPKDMEAVLKESPSLNPKDIADTVLHVVGTPPHVQIGEVIIKPTGEKF